MNTIGLRPAAQSDSEFCFQLHRSAMGDHVAAIWGWDDAVQRDYHEDAFDPDHWQIITFDGVDVGMLSVEYRPHEVYLARIEILPDHQGRGIGGHLIRHLIDEAHARGQHLTLDVLTVNHRAQALYRRHGLRETGRRGVGDIKIRMRCA